LEHAKTQLPRAENEFEGSQALREQQLQSRIAVTQRMHWQLLRNLEQHGDTADPGVSTTHRLALQRLAEREKSLDDLREVLEDQLMDLKIQRDALAEERQTWEDERRRECEAREALLRQQDSRAERRQSRLRKQREWLKQESRLLAQAKQEVRDVHARNLELQLATQQVWSKLTRSASPARLPHELAASRVQVTTYLLAQQREVGARAERVKRAAQQLVQRRRSFTEAQSRWQAWLVARKQELEAQAARLLVREREMYDREQFLRSQQADWQNERRDLKNQLAALLERIRRSTASE
jgi:hypothetical protein